MPIQTLNPATEEVVKTFEEYDAIKIEQALEKAQLRYHSHRQTPFEERKAKLMKMADILEQNSHGFAKIMTTEMGKTLNAAVSEVEKCADLCRFYAENGEEFLKNREIATDNEYSYVAYKPIGIILAVMPWNFPFWQVFRFIVPNLMAGNVGILKHASNVPQCALKIEEIILEAGFEEGCFQTFLVSSDKIEGIIQDERIRGVTLTGSEKAGQIVASQAGKVCKKTVLELGGSDAFIIMPSANLDEALDKGKTGRTMNNGQSCIAAKRFIVHEDIYDEFKARFVEIFEGLKVDDPMNEDTDIGPLSMPQTRDDLDELVEKSVQAGATKLCGAHKIEGRGYFYQPGILTDIPEDAPAYTEELFGPVALLFKVRNLDEAITLTNKVRFGLGSAIFTNDQDEIEKAVEWIDAGSTFINSFTASDPKLPFGGVKNSGYGRELSEEGIREFCNIKTVVKAK